MADREDTDRLRIEVAVLKHQLRAKNKVLGELLTSLHEHSATLEVMGRNSDELINLARMMAARGN